MPNTSTRQSVTDELDHDTMLEIKKHILMVNMDGINHDWCEGYFCAHVNLGTITENEHETLLTWLDNIYK